MSLLLAVCLLANVASTQPSFVFSPAGEPYLRQLRDEFKLNDVTKDATTDWDRARALCAWTHRQFRHDGNNQPQKNDPISILHEAAGGKRFRCVEYARVLAGACNSVGLPARVLSLKTKDVETRFTSAGHVVTEVYLKDRQAWAVFDPQWNAAPTTHDGPRSGRSFGEALDRNDPSLKTNIGNDWQNASYLKWIRPYLFYLDVRFDNRYGQARREPGGLMLVPAGAPEPKVFQRTQRLDGIRYTNSADDFYADPIIDVKD